MNSFRWLPFVRAEGATNMAADDVLLHTAAEKGIASLRFYGWSRATVSLGYFQAATAREAQAQLAQLPWVRRPSGGKTLVHHHELTYALALPPGFSAGWMPRMHQRVILTALNQLGLTGRIEVVEHEPRISGEFLCYEQQTRGDLVCAGKKVVGSAQRKYRQSLLQHGAILLSQSEHAPELPGIAQLTGIDIPIQRLQETILIAFQRETGWNTWESQWTPEEEIAILDKVTRQYGTAEWNEKR